MSDVASDVMAYAELKYNLEKWLKDEFDVDQNDPKRCITVFRINVQLFTMAFISNVNCNANCMS